MKPMVFNPQFYSNDLRIVLVGCGGTGSELAKIMARMLYDMKQRRLQLPRQIVFVDPDVIERKNVGRQNFAPAHVGMYKAHVLAERFSAALGIKIEYDLEPFNPDRYRERRNRQIILGAVDNAAARRAIASVNSIWIDSGCHFDAGQVVIGNTDDPDQIVRHWNPIEGELRYLGNAAVTFPELLVDEEKPVTEPTISCADALLQGDQHLLINQQMAMIAGQYLYKLLYRQDIRSHFTHVDIALGTMTSQYLTEDYIRE